MKDKENQQTVVANEVVEFNTENVGANSTQEVDLQPTKKQKFLGYVKKSSNNIFILGFSAMAQGLFATLIVGTIICQFALIFPKDGTVYYYVNAIGTFAKVMMGAGIGLAVAHKFNASVLTAVSCAVVGFLAAYSASIIGGISNNGVFEGKFTILNSVGEPLTAFICSYFSMWIGSLVSGKTKVDILVTPLAVILAGGTLALLLGYPISFVMTAFGNLINTATDLQPVLMGIIVSVLMGIALTMPISSAAIGISARLNGLAAGAATVGCCTHMVGFAVMSFRENKWGGLVSQGLGTSMLQIPNIFKRPILLVPPIIVSAILGPISSAVLAMQSNAVGSGMGTAGLVGVLQTFVVMLELGTAWWIVLLEVLAMYIVLPAMLCFAISELFRKLGWIKFGDLAL